MIWIFPMAGRGTRTKELGEFKPFIEIDGVKMLGWLLRSIAGRIKEVDELIFITTSEYSEQFNVYSGLEDVLRDEGITNSLELITTDGVPQGPSATVYHAASHLVSDEPAIVVNCDQYIDFDMPEDMPQRSGFLPVYAQFGEKSSYVEIVGGVITRVVEKQNISNLASAGVYAVSDSRALVRAIEKQFEKKQLTNNEFYIGPALNNLIHEGYRFYPTAVRAKYDLGNVTGIDLFEAFAESISGAKL